MSKEISQQEARENALAQYDRTIQFAREILQDYQEKAKQAKEKGDSELAKELENKALAQLEEVKQLEKMKQRYQNS